MESTEILTLESVQVPRFREAYESILPAIRDMPDASGCPEEADVPPLVARVLRAWPVIFAHQTRVIREEPQFDAADFDRLRLYALALGHAHSLHLEAAGALAECLAVPEQARALYRSLVTGMDFSSPNPQEPRSAWELANAIARLITPGLDPRVACRAQLLIDKLEAFPQKCASTQDKLFETGRDRNVLLGLLVATYNRLRAAVLNLPTVLPDVVAELTEIG